MVCSVWLWDLLINLLLCLPTHDFLPLLSACSRRFYVSPLCDTASGYVEYTCKFDFARVVLSICSHPIASISCLSAPSAEMIGFPGYGSLWESYRSPDCTESLPSCSDHGKKEATARTAVNQSEHNIFEDHVLGGISDERHETGYPTEC